MSKSTLAELQSVLNVVIKDEPLNLEDKVELTSNPNSNLKQEDYSLDDLHHSIDIKDEIPLESQVCELETCNQEIKLFHNDQNQRGTKRKHLDNISKKQIISVVSKKPDLWNPFHKDFKSANRLSIWQDVAKELGAQGEVSAQECKKKWNTIMEYYKYLKQNTKHRNGVKKWKYFNKLSFLDPYLTYLQNLKVGSDKSQKGSNLATPLSCCNDSRLKLDSCEETNKEISSMSSWLSSVNREKQNCKFSNNFVSTVSPCSVHRVSSIAEKKQHCKFLDDSVTTFFLSIENTVRKLPPDLQIQAKRNIFEAVTECELMTLNRNSNQQSS